MFRYNNINNAISYNVCDSPMQMLPDPTMAKAFRRMNRQRLTALLDQGAPRAKLVETIGHMVAASQASWHQRPGQNKTFQNHGRTTSE